MLAERGYAHLQRMPEEKAPTLDPDGFRPADKLIGKEDPDVFVVSSPVAGQVLPFEVGVDRHLGATASAYGWDQIDGGGTAAAPNQLQGFCRYLDVQSSPLPTML